ncbi:MAG: chorismate synthase, partial [Coriobacteriia bacterium]|nr:chorismate synthase [Coriobacteriia bacterium]
MGLLPRVTLFGQSHDPEVGVIIEGLPSGIALDEEFIDKLLERRRPGTDAQVTARKEADIPHIEAGVVNGVTTGGPIRTTFANTNIRSGDYEQFKKIPRPSHADHLAMQKYGDAHDIAGGGRFSARLTLPLTYAGAICLQILKERTIEVRARLVEVEGSKEDLSEHILDAKNVGDSVGGIVEVQVDGLPPGIGEHPFGGVEPVLAHLLFSIPGVRGVEFGAGFSAALMR